MGFDPVNIKYFQEMKSICSTIPAVWLNVYQIHRFPTGSFSGLTPNLFLCSQNTGSSSPIPIESSDFVEPSDDVFCSDRVTIPVVKLSDENKTILIGFSSELIFPERYLFPCLDV